MLSKAVLQTIICSTDLDKSETFFKDTLGLSMKRGTEDALIFDIGGSELRVCPVPTLTVSEHTLIGFSVENVTYTIRELTTRGIEFERFPNFPHDADGIVTTPDGSKVAWLRDPDQNLLSIVQYR